MKIRITTQYGSGTFALVRVPHNARVGQIIGCVTRSACTPGSWLCDVRRPTSGFATLPGFQGSLLGALRFVSRNALI